MKIKLDTKKIYLAMAENGISPADIARECEVSQTAIYQVLNGKRVGKNKVVPGICRLLGFSAKDIVIIED